MLNYGRSVDTFKYYFCETVSALRRSETYVLGIRYLDSQLQSAVKRRTCHTAGYAYSDEAPENFPTKALEVLIRG